VCVLQFPYTNACCIQSSLSLLARFQTKSMQHQAEENLPEEPKFGTSGRYHFELRSLTSCLAVKFITFTFKKVPRYTSVSFVFFFFSWQFSAMFSFTESDAALSSAAGRTSLLQATERREKCGEGIYPLLMLPHTMCSSLYTHIASACLLHKKEV